MTFKESDRDIGRVITGSSNFTQAGLIDNLEFNNLRSNQYIARRVYSIEGKRDIDDKIEIETCLGQVEGVQQIQVDLENNTIRIF